jgi:hypothetical protein
MNRDLSGRTHQLVLGCPSMKKFRKGSDTRSAPGNQSPPCPLTQITLRSRGVCHGVPALEQLTSWRTRWHDWLISIINRQGTLRQGNYNCILLTQDAIPQRPLQEKCRITTAPAGLTGRIHATLQSATSAHSLVPRKNCRDWPLLVNRTFSSR